jgi:hypothetical protein
MPNIDEPRGFAPCLPDLVSLTSSPLASTATAGPLTVKHLEEQFEGARRARARRSSKSVELLHRSNRPFPRICRWRVQREARTGSTECCSRAHSATVNEQEDHPVRDRQGRPSTLAFFALRNVTWQPVQAAARHASPFLSAQPQRGFDSRASPSFELCRPRQCAG